MEQFLRNYIGTGQTIALQVDGRQPGELLIGKVNNVASGVLVLTDTGAGSELYVNIDAIQFFSAA